VSCDAEGAPVNNKVALVTGLMVVVIIVTTFSCERSLNEEYERRCPEEGAAAGLPFKIAKIKGWSECYLKCRASWVPAEGFHGCRQ